MAARLLLAFGLAICLLGVGDRAAESWEVGYDQSIRWFNHAEFENTRKLAEAGYRQWRGRPQSSASWLFRLTLAESLIELDRVQDALPLLEASIATPEGEARRLADLAMARFRHKQGDLALQALAEASAIATAPGGETHGKIELVRGMLQMNKGQTAQAEDSFQRALAAVEGSDSLIEAYTLSDLGFLDLRRFHYDEALYWFERARDMARKNNLRRALELAQGNLGATFLYLGDFERAAKNLGEAASLAEELRDRVYHVRWLVVLGETWHEQGDLTKAAECYRKVLALVDPKLDTEWLADTLDDLSRIALEQGDLAKAADLNRQGTALAQQLERADPLLTHKIQAAAIAAKQHDYSTAESLYLAALAVSDRDPVAKFRCHSGLASAYRENGDAKSAELQYRAGAALTDEERAKLQQDESKFSYLAGLIQFYREYVDFLFDRGDAAGAFQVAESSRARVLEEKLHRDGKYEPAADLKSLERAARTSKSILLSYWLGPGRSWLWVIDSAGLHSFSLPPEPEIAAQVRRYQSAIQRRENPLDTGNEAGRWLFENLLSAHYQVPKNSNVVIEPDGPLHQLNFESLPAGGHYWIEDATVSVAPSLALLRESAYVPARRLLVFGDPGFEGTEYQKLSSVKAELEAVEQHFTEKSVFVSKAATPAAYLESHPENYSALHFATHAVANRESPLDSAIVLAGPAQSRKLYAREILQQPLTADLVTLSACETAGSRTYYGEGLTGFSWAFLSAGARNVVAGLWDIDDSATADLMKSFYDQLSRGLPPVSALRQAKLELIAGGGAYRKPLYWAAFETFTKALYR